MKKTQGFTRLKTVYADNVEFVIEVGIGIEKRSLTLRLSNYMETYQNRTVVSNEEAIKKFTELKSYLGKVTFKDAVHQCFFERGWSVTDFDKISLNYLTDSFEVK